MLKRKSKILRYSNNLWFLGEGMLGPLFAVFAERVGGSILEISLAWAIYLVTTGILIILIGKFSDKNGRQEELVTLGFALNAVFTFGYLFVREPFHLFIVQAGLGVATALSTPAWNSLYSRYEDKKRTSYSWGLAVGQANIATGIAIVIGGLIVARYSFTALFITMGIIQVIATLYQSKIIDRI